MPYNYVLITFLTLTVRLQTSLTISFRKYYDLSSEHQNQSPLPRKKKIFDNFQMSKHAQHSSSFKRQNFHLYRVNYNNPSCEIEVLC